MTYEEKLIISAYTSFIMVDFDEVHEFIEEIMGRPVFTFEMADKDFYERLRKKLKPKFIELCIK